MSAEEDIELRSEDARIARMKQITDSVNPSELSQPPIWNTFEIMAVFLATIVLCLIIKQFLYYEIRLEHIINAHTRK
jgi:hypothetical protein